MERFGSEGTWKGGRELTIAAPDRSALLFERECHYCGFTFTESHMGLGRCPKCGGSSWERRIRVPGSGGVKEGRGTVVRDIGRALATRGRH
jgi:hypothetical protein